jgi:hypothetical protein
LAFILLGALAGGFVNGLTGFGTALTGLPLWLFAVEPVVAAQLGAAGSVFGHISTLRLFHRAIDWRQLAPMVGAGMVGVPIGTCILPSVSLPTFKLTVGIALVVYCAFMLLAAGRIHVKRGGLLAELVVGFGGGILGGIAGLSGPLPTMWAALKAWPKDQRRAVFLAFNSTVLSTMLLASALQGLIGRRFLTALLVTLPGTVIGARLGSGLYRRLDDRRFDRLVLLVLLLSGLSLIWSSR